MIRLLAAEGGYQDFKLHGGEWFWLVFSALTALLAIGVGFGLMRAVLAEDEGTPKMKEIALAIEEGALAYLRRQFKTIGVIVVPLAILVFLTATKVVKPDGAVALSYLASGVFRTIAFLLGCMMSGLTGFIGMSLAVKGNVRTAAAAKRGSLPAALKVAFRTGGVAGMFTVGLGLIGATIIIIIFRNTSSAILVGFGFGGSLLALFLRVGGGIFTKAADVGADLVGKVEAGIPEDDPRNAATIADNVGDNVGDCAGMAADLFESYEVTLVASIILGVAAFRSIGANPALGLIFPVIARALGVLSSIVGVFAVKATEKDRSAMAPINRGFLTAGILTVVTTFLVAIFYVGNKHGNEGWKVFGAVTAGLILAQLLSRLTEYFTSTETRPVRDIAEAARTGPATVVLSGIASGLESSVYAVILIAITIGVAIAFSGGNVEFAFYLVALTGMGMLATTGVVVSEDTFGPVSDNAAGIAEMSGEFEGEAERIMVSLDAVGNTTKAVTKGFAIGSAVIAAVALFSSFIETIGGQVPFYKDLAPGRLFSTIQINVADPKTFIGLLIGGSIAFMFSSLAIRAVGRTAGTVVQEVRRQFREHPGIMDYTEKPEYGRVIDICTTSALRELVTPALLAVLTPIVIGFGLGYLALGAFLAAVILTGQLMANFLSNSGGAWDNAKKYIEDGHEGGKGSEAHKAAVIGDTVGDPFKDTAGPALNPLIKVMNLVSLLVLPTVISLSRGPLRTHPTGAGYTIAAGGLVVLIAAIAYSKRHVNALDTELPGTPPVGPAATTGVPAPPAYAPMGAGSASGPDAFGAPEDLTTTWAAPMPVAPAPIAPVPVAPTPAAWAPVAPTPVAPAPPVAPVPVAPAPAAPIGPAFISPTNQARFDSSRPISWVAVPGASEYCVTVGTTAGGDDLVNSGPLAAHQTALVVPSLPPGRTLYARIYGAVGGSWRHAEVSFTAAGPAPATAAAGSPPVAGTATAGPAATGADSGAATAAAGAGDPAGGGSQAALTWPAQGAVGVDTSRPFTWTRVPSATNYWLTIGTTEGGSDVLNTGPLPAGQDSYAALPSLPAGVPLFARLLTSDGADWTYADVIFTAAGH